MKNNKNKMKTVNIITLNGYFNYGNRLQNYALNKIIQRLGFSVANVWHKSLLVVFEDFVKALLFAVPKYRAYSKIYRFSKKNMREIRYKTNNKVADYYIVGSDQVWNPRLIDKDHTYFRAPDNARVFSYAASIGQDNISDDYLKRLGDMVSKYDNLSVREKRAKEILGKTVSDREIEVVLDPTLLLEQDDWRSICKKPIDIKENEEYILCYILGNKDFCDAIEEYARKSSKRIIVFSDQKDSRYGIEEFLYLIEHADLVCTDSFHASVFSFIFERPFVIFRRSGRSNNMYTRLQNFVDTFGLKNREYNGKEIIKENLEVDYTEAKKILKKEQKKSLDFLKKALDIKE